MADEEGIPFDRTINERLRGVSRMESLSIILEKAEKNYSDSEKEAMATRKNGYYVELIGSLTPNDMLPGAMDTLKMLKEKGIRIAIGSSSRNTPIILKQIQLTETFAISYKYYGGKTALIKFLKYMHAKTVDHSIC